MLDIATPGGRSVAPIHCPEFELHENEFCWGSKARVTQGKRIVYYKSFFFGGIEYSCYDSVYFYKGGEPEPYIGKILKVWEDRAENRNKMKVLWFFRPIEIPKWLEDDSNPAYKEIFLASGQGKGVTNIINALNVIVGKCKVLCTSTDKRNPQPSEEDLEAAHYFFYRRFDVDKYTVSEDMDLLIDDFGVEAIFNKQDLLGFSSAAGLSVERQTNEGDRVHNTCTLSTSDLKLEANKYDAVEDALKEYFHGKRDAVMLSDKEKLIVDGVGIRTNAGLGDVATSWKEAPKNESVKEKIEYYKRLKMTPDIVGNKDTVNEFSMGISLGVTKDTTRNEVLGSETIPSNKTEFIDGSPRACERLNYEEELTAVKTEINTGHEKKLANSMKEVSNSKITSLKKSKLIESLSMLPEQLISVLSDDKSTSQGRN